MRFSIFVSILQSPKTETFKKRKKSRKIVFPESVPSVYFQKGLNPQIVENKEIHRNLYKIVEWNYCGFWLLHVASFIDHKIFWIYKVQYGYSKKWWFSQNYEKWI